MISARPISERVSIRNFRPSSDDMASCCRLHRRWRRNERIARLLCKRLGSNDTAVRRSMVKAVAGWPALSWICGLRAIVDCIFGAVLLFLLLSFSLLCAL